MLKFLLYALLVTLTYAASVHFDGTESVVPQLDGRIVGGKEVSVMNHPHQVSLRYKSCEECAYSHLCGGSILNGTVVVTAAHCINRRDATNIMVVAGTNNRRGSDGVIVPVLRGVMHEKYNATITDNDVALLFLALEIPINNVTIAPIKLASKHPDDGVKSVVTGWGTTTQGGVASELLMEVEVPIVSNFWCGRAYGQESITPSMLCAGTPLGGKDACQGDSGGPLVVASELAGIVSWGEGCAQPDYPGVYASVAYLKNWIEAKMNGEEPPIDDDLYIDFI